MADSFQDAFDEYISGAPTDQQTSTGSAWSNIFDSLPSVLSGAAGIIGAVNRPRTVAAATPGVVAASSNVTKYLIFGGIGLVVVVVLFLFVGRSKPAA